MALVCKQCGSVEAEGRFCSQCGGPLAEVQEQQAMGAMPQQAPQAWPGQAMPPQPPQAPMPQQAPQGWPQPAAPQQAPQAWPQAAPQQAWPQAPMPQQAPGVWPQQPGPQQYAPYPQQPIYQPAPRKKGGWGKWVAIAVAVVVVLFGTLAYLGQDEEPTDVGGNQPAPTQPQTGGQQGQGQGQTKDQPQPKTDTAAKSGTASFKLAASGSFGIKGEFVVPYKNFVAVGKDSMATLYKIDAKGAASKLRDVSDSGAGDLLQVTIGDMFNNGNPMTVVLFEKKAYFVPTQGEVTSVENTDGTRNVLIGDWDGDGKNETVFLKELEDGTHGFDVWRYEAGKENSTPIYKKTGVKDPFPVLYQSTLKAGKNNVILGYIWEGEKLSAALYKWDGLGGPVEIGRYPIEQAADAHWLTLGPTPLGPTMAVSRAGAKPSVELLTISSDAKSATSLGKLTPDGSGWSAISISSFMGGETQLMTVDDAGKYYIYDLFYK